MAEGVIEALVIRLHAGFDPQVPFADKSRCVAFFFEHLRNRDLLGRQAAVEVRSRQRRSGCIRGDACSQWITPRQQPRPRRRTDRSRRIELRKPHTPLGQNIEVRRDEILRPISMRIERPLVVGEDDDDIGPGIVG